MLKFKVSSDRLVEAISIIDYISLQNGSRDSARRLLPRFMLDKDGAYFVKVTYDDDGDILTLENNKEAFLQMTAITPKRSERLIDEMLEAVKNIVNPQSGGGSATPTGSATEQPPGG